MPNTAQAVLSALYLAGLALAWRELEFCRRYGDRLSLKMGDAVVGEPDLGLMG